MKSYGQLWEKIVSEESLLAAWKRVRFGHARSVAIGEFEKALSDNLAALREDLISGVYEPAEYRQFRILDPKPRLISCASVRDRVVHHALCGVIAPLLERAFIDRSYACRRGKGSHLACLEAREQLRHYRYFVKLDVRHYFDSISHDRLLGLLSRRFREREVNGLIAKIVRHPLPGATPGLGLPVGNLTSQWFANFYLDGLDHQIVEDWGRGAAYVRYMDDMCLFTDDKKTAWGLHDRIRQWLEVERGLSLKDEATLVAPVDEGMPFLGLRVFPGCWRLKRARFQRTRHVFAERTRAYEEGRLDECGYAQTVASIDGALRWFGFKNILNDLAAGEGAASGSNRVNRGGSYNNNANNCRSAYRNNNNPSNTNNNLGFRPVSIMLDNRQAGSHPVPPGLREAETNMLGFRSASSSDHRRAESLPFQLAR